MHSGWRIGVGFSLTLLKAFAQLVISGEEVDGGGDGWVVGCN